MARLSDEEIEQRLAGLEGWERDGDAIAKTYEGDDFMSSVGLVNRLAPGGGGDEPPPGPRDLLEQGDRHALHALEGGLTANDFELAGTHRRPCRLIPLGGPATLAPFADERRRAPSK